MPLNLSQIINNKTVEVRGRLETVTDKILTTTTNRQALIKRRDKLIEMLKKLKAIEIQSSGFDAMEDK